MQDLIEPVVAIVLFVGGKESLAVNQILRNMPIEYETPLQRRQIAGRAPILSHQAMVEERADLRQECLHVQVKERCSTKMQVSCAGRGKFQIPAGAQHVDQRVPPLV